LLIDKVELRAGPEIPFRQEFEAIHQDIRGRAKETPYFREVMDLRPIGIKAFLHTVGNFTANRKLELVGTGAMSFRQMEVEAEKVFEWTVGELELMRVDFAADLPGVEVEWFWMHARARNKRSAEIIRGSGFGSTGDTVHFGHHPDCYRIYNKSAQLVAKYGPTRAEQELRQILDINRIPSCPDRQLVLTRAERQLAGRSIPKQLATFEALTRNVTTFNPFDRLTLLPGGQPQPVRGDYKPRHYREGRGLRIAIEEDGLASTWKEEQRHGNARRTFERLAPFIPPDPENFAVPDLFALHREGLRFQLGESR
jgi:hypothetical protein